MVQNLVQDKHPGLSGLLSPLRVPLHSQGALTVLPLRCLYALWRMLTHLLLPSRRSRHAGGSGSNGGRPPLLPGAQLYDLLCALLMLGAVAVLSQIKPGVLYYWMKDITSEFLKIQVLFTALEILDKVGGGVEVAGVWCLLA
jgi:hypothetical protein